MSILGIAQSNHGSAAAVYDGTTLHACQEERFDRKKWSPGFPQKSVEWCVERAGGFNNIEAIGFYLSSSNYLLAESNPGIVPYPDFLHVIPNSVLKNMKPAPDIKHIRQSIALFNGSKRKIDFYFIDHHLCHAAGSFYLSPFDKAAILVMDGTGDGYSMSLWKGEGNKVTPILRQPFPHSLGQFYKTFTQYLGFKSHDQFKVMGLAAYGDGAKYYDRMRVLINLERSGGFSLNMNYFAFQMVTATQKHNLNLEKLLGIRPYDGPTDDPPQEYRDLAAAVQDVTVEAVTHVVGHFARDCGLDNLVYTGGVALNCAANGRVFPKSDAFPDGAFRNVYIPPHPGDGGLAVAAAAYIKHGLKKAKRSYVYDSDFIGPGYFDDEIKKALDNAGATYTQGPKSRMVPYQPDCYDLIVAALAKGKIVGVFDGPAEFGPRALGNRSILASPRYAKMKDQLNQRVKMRESFRPFAPACLDVKVGDVFECDNNPLIEAHPERFMLYALPVRKEWRKKIPAVTHEDDTGRVQVVYLKDPLYPILKGFYIETDIPVILNTSFNVRGEPIVLAPKDAIRCFYSTGIDCLAIGPYWLEK